MKQVLSAGLLFIFLISVIHSHTSPVSSNTPTDNSQIFSSTLYELKDDTITDVTNIAVSDIAVWGTSSQGLVKLLKADGSFRILKQADGLLDATITDVAVDTDNNVWIATPKGLSRLNRGSWKHFTTVDGLPSNNIVFVNDAIDGSVLVGTDAGGVSRFDGSAWQHFQPKPDSNGIDPNDLSNCLPKQISDAVIDTSGNIWTLTKTYPICYFNGTIWQTYKINSETVAGQQLAAAPNGDIWLTGTRLFNEYGTLQIEADFSWTLHNTQDGMLVDESGPVDISESGDVWVGAYERIFPSGKETQSSGYGLSKYDGVTWTIVNNITAQNIGNALDIEIDGENVWLSRSTIHRLQNGVPTTYSLGASLFSNGAVDVRDMFVDNQSNLWVGAYNAGAALFDGSVWSQHTRSTGLPCDWVDNFELDIQNNMWAICYVDEPFSASYAGVTVFDGADWTLYTTDDGLASNIVNDIDSSPDGEIFFATRAGLTVKSGNTWMTETTTDGLVENHVKQVFVHGDRTWIAYNSPFWPHAVSWRSDGVWNHVNRGLLSPNYRGNNYSLFPNGENILGVVEDLNINFYNGTGWSVVTFPSSFEPTSMIYVNDGNAWFVNQTRLLMLNEASEWRDIGALTKINLNYSLYHKLAVDTQTDEVWLFADSRLYKLKRHDINFRTYLPTIHQ